MQLKRLSLALVLAALAVQAALPAQQRDPRQYQQVLESPDRLADLQVDKVVSALALKPGMRVADLGAGTGVFTLPLAKAVGAEGRIYAIDIDEGLLKIVSEKIASAGLKNVQLVTASPTDPRLPEPVDLIFLCDTLHHISGQAGYVKQFSKLLRPGGRVVVIEFAEGHWPAGHEQFAISPAQVDGWMQAAGFTRTMVHSFLKTNFFHVYEPRR